MSSTNENEIKEFHASEDLLFSVDRFLNTTKDTDGELFASATQLKRSLSLCIETHRAALPTTPLRPRKKTLEELLDDHVKQQPYGTVYCVTTKARNFNVWVSKCRVTWGGSFYAVTRNTTRIFTYDGAERQAIEHMCQALGLC